LLPGAFTSDALDQDGWLMVGRSSVILWVALASVFPDVSADAGDLMGLDNDALPIVEASPTLAPFQHVRFCLRYPSDCQPTSVKDEPITLNAQSLALLRRVNDRINSSIISKQRSFGSNLEDAWTIALDMGDCNDYAVTKRHELLKSGFPSNALRLSADETAAGIGHLLLVVVTTKGNLVMDNLIKTIRPWRLTDYQWLRIQSAHDPHYWSEVRSDPPPPRLSLADPKIRLAGSLGK